jgi:Glycosyl transferases group 1
MESVTVITEPLLHPDFVQFEIVVPILERLQSRYDLTVAAPRIGPLVRERLESRGIQVADGGVQFPPLRRPRDEIPSYVGSWARDALWGWNRRGLERALRGTSGIRINVSMTTAIDADAWLIQSRPLGMALDALRHGVNGGLLRAAVTAAAPIVGPLDEHHLMDAARRARVRYTTTQHVADWFRSRGLPVEGVLPMYYRPTIHPTTQNPSRDSVLVYVGKETDSAALRMLLETGLPVTMFGSKSVGWVVRALQLYRYPHARLLGHVSDEELSDLYSNARFTAFPFTEEPFGLIPLESMACGTPILTYGMQGPAESVLDGRTGWLVTGPEEFARRAVELWKLGVPSSAMVAACKSRARSYHIDTVGLGWSSLFESAAARSGGYSTTGRWGRNARSSWANRLPTTASAPSGSEARADSGDFTMEDSGSSGTAPVSARFARSGGYSPLHDEAARTLPSPPELSTVSLARTVPEPPTPATS